ncbi:MAG TPA: hypothetical protein VGX91_08885 [Candidatus Cybelea sp.]|jgi:hypothetical protein|nr:hypothetical protein [Candidatus Cybelea sp.]
MDLDDIKELRRSILQMTLDHVDGREQPPWLAATFLAKGGIASTEGSRRIVNREIRYLSETKKINAKNAGEVWVVTGITALGRDDLE